MKILDRYAIVSKGLGETILDGRTPVYEIDATFHPTGNTTTIQYFDVGGELIVHYDDDGPYFTALVESYGTDVKHIAEDIEWFIRDEREGIGDDIQLEPADGYDPIGPLPCEIEREDIE